MQRDRSLWRSSQWIALGALAGAATGILNGLEVVEAAPKSQTPTNAYAAAPAATVDAATASSVMLVPFRDPWSAARDRWWDISNKPFNAFLNSSQTFFYYSGQVTLSYDAAPGVPYFVGHIEASGLKPNFAYQIKLLGKPERGSRGWGGLGDDWANEQLGYAGRWWTDDNRSAQTNFSDSVYLSEYKNSANTNTSVYGYLYMGMFVTDEFGNASHDFTGKSSYHITWASWQSGIKDVQDFNSPFSLRGGLLSSSPLTYYGYGSTAPAGSVGLYYEYEPNGRPRNNVRLPNGIYRCRLLLTEESFHNSSTNGGYWKSVLTSEDYAYGNGGAFVGPDTASENDIVFTIGNPTAPAAPIVTATGGDKNVSLSWPASAGAYRYVVKRGLASGGPYETLSGRLYTPGYTDSGLTNGTTYYYVVSAINSVGETVASTVAATPQIARPAAPTGLVANVGNAKVTLNWNASATATSYTVKRGTTSGSYSTIFAGLTTTTFTDTGLTNGTTYYYVVTASNLGGESTPSSQVSAIPQAAPQVPAAPSQLVATALSRSKVKITWTDNSGNESGFKLERSTNGTTFNQFQTVGTNVTTYTVGSLSRNTTHYFRVRAYNAAGDSVYSNIATVKTPN